MVGFTFDCYEQKEKKEKKLREKSYLFDLRDIDAIVKF